MVDKDEALKLGLQVVEAAEYLANNPAIFGEYVQEKRASKRALIQRSKIAFEEALAQPEQESDDLTAAYLSGVYDGKNKNAPQRKPLTDEQWQEIAAITGCLRIEKRGRDAILRVLEEAAHGIKE